MSFQRKTGLGKTLHSLLKRTGYLPWLPDSWYLKLAFRATMGKKLDLRNPRTFNEKLQWLKLYNRRPEYTDMVDKYAVRRIVADRIGEEYLIPLLGVWDNFDDVDFSKLPDQFVLKCTHDSASVIICKDKSSFDYTLAKTKLERSLRRNYYYSGREWPYKKAPRKIIAERFLVDELSNFNGLTDYKLFCFGGKVDCVMLCLDRYVDEVKYRYFDRDWNVIQIEKDTPKIKNKLVFRRPQYLEEMIRIAEKLSYGIPFVRVDLFEHSGNVYFGEMTFFPAGGFDSSFLPEEDRRLGSLLDLELVQNP